MIYKFKLCLLLIGLFIPFGSKAQKTAIQTFTNPLLPSGADPWVIYKDGFYYYTNTLGNRSDLWKTKDLSNLKNAERKTVWRPPVTGLNSSNIWAPELHFLNGKWYLYYTAADVKSPTDANRYIFVLENASANPLEGTWIDKGKINTNYSGLDGSVFEHRGKTYFVYSAYVGPQSRLFISEMQNPWTLSAKQVEIGAPTFTWEKLGGRQILEGPQFLKGKKNQIFLVYSASACWDDNYSLGMLTASAKRNLLDPASWQKSPEPVFHKSIENSIYAPGHNSFFKSPNGKEDWILYHANSAAGQGCGANRAPRAQKFTWNKDGSPNFGVPVKAGTPLVIPAIK